MDSYGQIRHEPFPTINEEIEKPNNNKTVEKSRQCPICHVYYKYGNSYWQHVRYVHASFLSQCVICEKCYKRTTMAKHHILHSHKIAWHLCNNYVRKIRKTDLQQRQNMISTTEKKNSNLKFFKKKTLHLIKAFNCYNCPGSFSSVTDLFQHVKSHKNDFYNFDYDEIENIECEEINDLEKIEHNDIEEIPRNEVKGSQSSETSDSVDKKTIEASKGEESKTCSIKDPIEVKITKVETTESSLKIKTEVENVDEKEDNKTNEQSKVDIANEAAPDKIGKIKTEDTNKFNSPSEVNLHETEANKVCEIKINEAGEILHDKIKKSNDEVAQLTNEKESKNV